MKSSDLSAKAFFQKTVDALLELCTHCIDGHSIVNIEGHLLLTLDTGDKVELNILQHNVRNLLNPTEDDDTNATSSEVTADAEKNLHGDLLLETERVLAVKDSVSIKSTDNVPKFDNSTDSGAPWRSYPCKDCDNVLFTSSGLLRYHRMQMHGRYKCQKCGLDFIGRLNFSQHVHKEHPGLPICKAQKSFVCEYCSQTFHNEALLKDHISTIHLGAVEHRCDDCGKVLGSALTLRIHRRQLHEHTTQQTCDGCGRQFARLALLISHLTTTHPHLLPDKYRHRLAVCKECNLTFSRRTSLKRHLEVRHGGLPNYACPVCSRRFRCQRYVRRHLRAHHPSFTNRTVKMEAVVVDTGNEDSTAVANVLEESTVDSSDF